MSVTQITEVWIKKLKIRAHVAVKCHSCDISESTSHSFVAQLVTKRTGVSFSRIGPQSSNVAIFFNSLIFSFGIISGAIKINLLLLNY